MRVAKMVEVGKIDIFDEPKPFIRQDNEVLVAVKALGICGTDMHLFREGRADVQLPRVMGHELSGVVEAVGSAVDRVRPGDRVVLDPVFACRTCSSCRKGYVNVCENVRCFGVQMDGGLQDYIVVDQNNLYSFDPAVSFEEAALAEPFSVAANILGRAGVSEQDAVLIIGSGTIGLSVLQWAKGLGASVMVADVLDSKLKTALEMGADRVVNSTKCSLAEAASDFAGGSIDVIIDAVGVTEPLQQAIDAAAPRSRIVCIGFDITPALIPPSTITRKELTIIGSRMNCHRFPEVVEWLNQGKIDANKMITAKYPLDQIQKAFEETMESRENGIKTMILF